MFDSCGTRQCIHWLLSRNIIFISGGESTSDSSINLDPVPSVTKKKRVLTKKRIHNKGKRVWEEEAPIAQFHLTGVKELLKEDQLRELMTNYPAFSTPDTKIVQVAAGDTVAYENVEQKDIVPLASMDGYLWRFKGNLYHDREGPLFRYQFKSQLEEPQVYHNLFTKSAYYDAETKRMLVVYSGDPQYGWMDDHVVHDAPEEEWPSARERKYPGTDDLRGNKTNVEKYKKNFSAFLPEGSVILGDVQFTAASDTISRKRAAAEETTVSDESGNVNIVYVIMCNHVHVLCNTTM